MLDEFLPEHSVIDTITMPDGVRLRTGYFPASGAARATILLVNGHREFIEKYTEFINDLQKRGFDIFSYDHRGQGGSDRLLDDRMKSHNPDFGRIIKDMDEVVKHKIKPDTLSHPLYLVGHSMGAQLVIRYLHDYPEVFHKAVLLTPFTNFNIGGRMFTILAKFYVNVANFLGFSKVFAPGQARNTEMIDHEYAFECLTHDRDRYDWSQRVLVKKPDLFISGVTIGWIKGVMNSMKVIRKNGYVEQIETPVLALLAEEEKVVDNEMTIRLLSRMPNAAYQYIDGARHEMYREIDVIRDLVLTKITDFLSD